MRGLISLLLMSLLRAAAVNATTHCPNSSLSAEDTKPLYLVTQASFSRAINVVAGAIVAQEEINNRTNLLPGYHIELIITRRESCSSDHVVIGLSHLLEHITDPPCRPVVAVSGLACSSHTAIMSPIIGHDGFDLIHLSTANSPIFRTQNHRFPHLWTFAGSAADYSDVVLALMDQFNWKRVGLVYNSGSVFTHELARYFEESIRMSPNKHLAFNEEINDRSKIYFDRVISSIKSQGATILVAMLREDQDSFLVTRAIKEGLIYPQYIFIHVEIKPEWLLHEHDERYDHDDIYSGVEGHIFLFPSTDHNRSTHLVSDQPYSAFRQKFIKTVPQLEQYYNETEIPAVVEFGSFSYDQVWALALALNNSLPILRDKNLSIDNYTIGQPEITNVIEEQMARLNFQGAGGLVEFNQYRSVSTPVGVNWFIGKTERNVGIYNSLNANNFHVNISVGDLPKDSIDDEYALIPLPVAVVLYVATSAVIVFISVQLCLYMYLHYKKCKVVRATSPYLRLVMFAGCYLYCVAAIFTITQGSFVLSPGMFSATICLLLLSVVNAFSLILTTLFIIQLRVYHIFRSSKSLKSGLGKQFKNYSLLFFIFLISFSPNLIFFVTLFFEVPSMDTYKTEVRRNSLFMAVIHFRLTGTAPYVAVACMLVYLALFLLLILFLAFRTRKITYRNFKDTKKNNLFIAVVFFVTAFGSSVVTVLFLSQYEPEGYVVLTVCLLILPTTCQLVLFLPKILPTVLSSILRH